MNYFLMLPAGCASFFTACTQKDAAETVMADAPPIKEWAP